MLQLLLADFNLLFLWRLLLLIRCCRLITAPIVSNFVVILVTSTDSTRHHVYSVILSLFVPAKIVSSPWIASLRSYRLLLFLHLGVIFLGLVMLRESFLVGLGGAERAQRGLPLGKLSVLEQDRLLEPFDDIVADLRNVTNLFKDSGAFARASAACAAPSTSGGELALACRGY